MKNKTLTNALNKAGLNVIAIEEGRQYKAIKGDKFVSWIVQNDSALCVNCGRLSDPSDSMIDYFPGFYAHSIKQAVNFFNW